MAQKLNLKNKISSRTWLALVVFVFDVSLGTQSDFLKKTFTMVSMRTDISYSVPWSEIKNLKVKIKVLYLCRISPEMKTFPTVMKKLFNVNHHHLLYVTTVNLRIHLKTFDFLMFSVTFEGTKVNIRKKISQIQSFPSKWHCTCTHGFDLSLKVSDLISC